MDILIVLLAVTTTNIAYSQNSMSDSVPDLYGELEEIVIERPEVAKVNGMDIYFPSENLKKGAKSGVKLLFDMQIPSIDVDPINNTIKLIGEGNLHIMINGRPANVQDVMNLNPADIQKIEYNDNPSMRHKDADATIDIIVKKRESGGSFFLNALTGLNHGWGNYQLSLKSHLGKNEVGVYYQATPMYDINCWRDNNDKIIFPNGTAIERYEIGIPQRNDNITGNGKIYYNFSIPKKLLFSLEFKFNNSYNSNDIAGNIIENDFSVFQTDRNPVKSINPVVDAYLQYNINNKQKLYFNAIYSYTKNHSERHYSETPGEVEINSEITGYDKYISIEGAYEHKFSTGVLSTGLRHKSYWSKEYFSNSPNSVIRITENVSSAFAQWQHNFERLSYSIGLTGDLYHNNNESYAIGFSKITLQPELTLRYTINYNSSIKAILKSNSELPSIAAIYPELQQIDKWQYSKGNPDLRPFTTYSTSLEYDMNYGIFPGKLITSYDYADNPIMSYKYWDSDKLIKSYQNQRGWHKLKVELDYRLNLIKNMLTLSGTAGWQRFISQGNNYSHCYDQPFFSAQLTFNHKSWFALAKFNTNINKLWGEEIYGGWNMQIIGVGYTYKNAMFMAGMTNSFINNFHVTSRDLNKYASYDREYYTNCTNNLVWIGITINTSWGKHFKGGSKKFDNDYSRDGVTTTGK